MFHSYHAGNVPPERFKAMRDAVGNGTRILNWGSTIPNITMPATMIAEAANNHLWISRPNPSARESCRPDFFVRPDGVVTGRLRPNTSGVLVSEVNTDEQLYDSTVDWRDRAMDGIFRSGTLVRDRRSDDRTRA